MASLNHYLVGSAVVMIGSCEVVNPLDPDDKTPTDPTTVTFYRRTPDGVLTTYELGVSPEVTHLATGIDACTVPVTQAGVEKWRYEADGACTAPAEDEFKVLPSSVLT